MIRRLHPSRPRNLEVWTRERLVRERAIALSHTLAEGTIGAYASALNKYLDFCRLHDLSPEPTEETLSFFVVWACGHMEPRAVNNYLSGIVSELQSFYPTARTNRLSKLVTKVLRGCKRLYSQPIRRKRALTKDDLRLVHDTIGYMSDHDHTLFLTLLLTGFHALMRLGELVTPDSARLRDPRKVSTRDSVAIYPSAFEFLLTSHKADPLFEGNRILVQAVVDSPDPRDAFIRYLQARDARFGYRWELWIRADGSVPTRSWFIKRLQVFFPRDVSGHSMRSGGATSLAENGVAPSDIQRMGRWSSDAFHTYVRTHPVLTNALLFGGRALHDGPG